MTDLSTAMTDSSGLSSYKGRDVLRTNIAIRNAGDGLSQAMAISPVELTIGDRVFVVLECEVAHHDYGPIKDTDCLELKQVLRAEGATLVDEDLVRAHLDEQFERIRIAREQAAGVERLPMDGDLSDLTDDERDEREAMVVQHNSGVHRDGLRDECPLCQEERQAEEDEAGGDGAGEAIPIGKAKPGGRKRSTGSK